MNTNKSISARCPYCETDIKVETSPIGEKVISLPFGRMPEHPDNVWTRVGFDFLGAWGWDRFGPGIMRVSKEDRVYYRVENCHNCCRPFDIYSSDATSNLKTKIWPYLFGECRDRKPLFVAIITRIVGENQTPLSAGTFGALLYFTIISLPLLLSGLFDRAWQAIAVLQAASFGTLVYAYLRVLRILKDKTALQEFLDVRHREGLHYWANFQRMRYTGIPFKGKMLIRPFSQKTLVGVFGLIVFSVLLIFTRTDSSIPDLLDLYEIFCCALFVYFFYMSIWICSEGPFYIIRIVEKLNPKTSSLNNFWSLRTMDDLLNVSFWPIFMYSISLVGMRFIVDSTRVMFDKDLAAVTVLACLACMVITISVILWENRTGRAALIITTISTGAFLFSAPNIGMEILQGQIIVGIGASVFLVLYFLLITVFIARIRQRYLNFDLANLADKIERIKNNSQSYEPSELDNLLSIFEVVSGRPAWRNRLIMAAKILAPLVAAIAANRVTNILSSWAL